MAIVPDDGLLLSGRAVSSEIIDELYEASVAVERWPRVLERLTALAGGAGASLVSGGVRPLRWIATPAMQTLIEEYGRQPHANSRIAMALPNRVPSFQTDLDLFTREAMDADPFYTEFLRPRGFGWVLGTTIAAPGTDPIIFSIERHFRSGPAGQREKELFDALRPHMARAMLLSAQLNLERAKAMAEALAVIGLPVTVLDLQGRAVASNALFEALVPALAQDRRERLVLCQASADRLLCEALRRFRTVDLSGIQSIPIRPRPPLPAAAAHLVPVRGLANDVFSPGFALLLITPAVPRSGPQAALLEALFDLSPAEAHVARGVAEARTLEAIAHQRGVSKETVRVQLRAVLAKTGTQRQAELVRLLASIADVTPLDRD